MEVLRERMVHLGYGKFWRSDEIVGLSPIDNGRGPGRRTEVYVATRGEPVVASRTERAILGDMVELPAEGAAATEARDLLGDLLEDLADVPQVLRRLLMNEVGLDVDAWERRITAALAGDSEGDDEQEDLFTEER